MNRRRNKSSDALAIAGRLGVKLGNIEEVYKGIKPYEPLDNNRLSLREFAELTGLKYKYLLRAVRKAAPTGRWDLLPMDIALHVTTYGAQFESCKGRGVEKVEFRVSIGTTDHELRDKVDCIVAKRPPAVCFTRLKVYDSSKKALEGLAATSHMTVAKVLDIVLAPYVSKTTEVASEGTKTGATQLCAGQGTKTGATQLCAGQGTKTIKIN